MNIVQKLVDWMNNNAQLRQIDLKLNTVIDLLMALNQKEHYNMATLQNIVDAVSAEKTVEDSVVALLGQLSAQLTQALANGNDPVAIQNIVDSINNNAAVLGSAVVSNTPVAPAPTPDPTATP